MTMGPWFLGALETLLVNGPSRLRDRGSLFDDGTLVSLEDEPTWSQGPAINEADRSTCKVDKRGTMPYVPDWPGGGVGTQVVGGPIPIKGQGRR